MALASKRTVALTINGVDGFESGKWFFDSAYTVISDSILSANYVNGVQSVAKIFIPVIAGSTYTVSGIFDANNVRIRVGKGSDYSMIASTVGKNSTTFIVPNGETSVLLQVDNAQNNPFTGGTFTFSNIMLNLGTTPASYEPKRGDKMVMPVPVKNLFNYANSTFDQYLNANGTLGSSGAGNSTSDFIAIKPNAVYTLSGIFNVGNYSLQYNFYDVNKNPISSFTYNTNTNSWQLNSPANATYLRFSFNKANQQVQLEQGNIATPFTPYAVQLNQKPLRSLPSSRVGAAKR